MKLKPLACIRLGVDFLTIIAVLALFLPWLLAGEHLIQQSMGLSLFWRLVILVLWGRYMTRFLQRTGQNKEENKQTRDNIIFILFSLGLILFLVYFPGWGDLPEDNFTWFWFGLLGWLWGMKSGTDEVTARTLHRVLTGGACSMALFFYIIYRMGFWEAFLPQAFPFALGWFFIIIFALALHRLLEYSQEGGEKEQDMGRFWSPFIAGLALVGLFVTALFSLIVPGVVNLLRIPARALLALANIILTGILWILGYIAAAVIYVLNFFLTPVEWEIELEEQEGLMFTEEGEGLQEATGVSETAFELASIIIALVVVGIVAYIVLALVKKRKPGPQAPEETRESLASASAFSRWAREGLTGLQNAWKDRWARFKRPRDYKTATEIYNALLRALKDRGYPRPAGVTAHRFQERIRRLLAEGGEQADRILDYFAREYYAGKNPSAEAIETLQGDLSHLLPLIRDLEKKQD